MQRYLYHDLPCRLLPLLLLPFIPFLLASSNSFYSNIWRAYRREVREKPTDQKDATFRRYWISQFSRVLEQPPTEDDVAYRSLLMGEMGALALNLGEVRQALQTYHKMEEEALRYSALTAAVDALDSQLHIASHHDVLDSTDILELSNSLHITYQKLFEDASAHTRQRYLTSYSDSMFNVANALLDYAKRESTKADATENHKDSLLQKALDSAKIAVSIEKAGFHSQGQKLFTLATAYKDMGERELAYKTYHAILNTDCEDYTPLYIRHCAIGSLYDKDSPEYQEHLKEALQQYNPNREDDIYWAPLVQELAFSYIRSDKYSDAIEVLESVCGRGETNSINATNMYLMGRCHVQLKQYEIAREIFKQVISSYPDTGAAAASKNMIGLSDHELTIMTDKIVAQAIDDLV